RRDHGRHQSRQRDSGACRVRRPAGHPARRARSARLDVLGWREDQAPMSRRSVKGVAVLGALAAGAVALAPAAAAEETWTMPNLIGTDLQGARGAIQSLTDGAAGVRSPTDRTGQGRRRSVA